MCNMNWKKFYSALCFYAIFSRNPFLFFITIKLCFVCSLENVMDELNRDPAVILVTSQ